MVVLFWRRGRIRSRFYIPFCVLAELHLELLSQLREMGAAIPKLQALPETNLTRTVIKSIFLPAARSLGFRVVASQYAVLVRSILRRTSAEDDGAQLASPILETNGFSALVKQPRNSEISIFHQFLPGMIYSITYHVMMARAYLSRDLGFFQPVSHSDLADLLYVLIAKPNM
jgi:hypothetical protein